MRVEHENIVEKVALHLDWDDVRLELINRNRRSNDLSLFCLSTISETMSNLEVESELA